MQRGEYAHRFHSDNHARTVVGSAGARDPAIEVPSYHDDLVFQVGIDAGNLGNGVEALFVFAGEFRVDSNGESDRNLVLQKAAHTAKVFAGEYGGGNGLLVIRQVGFPELLA